MKSYGECGDTAPPILNLGTAASGVRGGAVG